ncbi:MAG: hypothetical protein HUU09_15525 [Candidatus Jettenia caeni]|nr:hypothetical protein [Candidatus Jettenia caeni]UJS17312.1 MAG: PKD domain-containing protein [Candidatus Jettenia sp.]
MYYDIFIAKLDSKLSAIANILPIANAGTDQTVHVGTTVSLDGSGSSDPDGNIPLPTSGHLSLSHQEVMQRLLRPHLPQMYGAIMKYNLS